MTGRVELAGELLDYVERDCYRTMVRRLGPVPAGAGIALDLLARRKDGAPRLAGADDVGDCFGVLPRQRRREQDVVELAQMPLLRPARVVERPAVEFGPPLDDVLAEAASRSTLRLDCASSITSKL